jgi:hypothetical protein
MPTKPINEFIPREIDNPDLKRILEHLSSLIEEVVNRSSHIFRWGIDSIKGGDENMPAFLMFRHIFELIDSISVLIRSSAVEPCNILLRSLFESYLNFEYLFEKDFKSRGMDFVVWYRHNEIKNLRRYDPKDEMYAQYEKLKARDKISKEIPAGPVPSVVERMDSIKKIFELPSYKGSVEEYQRLKAASKGKAPKHWYSMHDGPKDVCQLADRLDFPAQYETLYRSWSELVHGTDILKDKITLEAPGVVSFSSLRMPSEAPNAAIMAIALGLAAIRIFTEHYIPERAKKNADWYHSEIDDPYKKMMDIKIIVI